MFVRCFSLSGNLLSATEDQAAVGDMYGFGPAASGLGVRTSYTLDALNRVTRYEHADTATGQGTKRADYAYRGDGSVSQVTRFAGTGVNPVGTITNAYDGLGRITGITHAPAASPSIAYVYAYDIASRMTSMTSPEGTSSFTLDATDQILSASLTGESYAYDKTGNRTSGGTQTGSGNRLAFDGTYRYAYDAEGNRTAKFIDTDGSGALSAGDTDVTAYGYDQRNRLVAVSHVATWTTTQAAALGSFVTTGLPGSDLELRYTYDYADRRIRRSIDADGIAGAGQESVSFAAYAGDVRTLEIARPNDKLVIDSATGKVLGFLGQVVQRNLYGNGVDEILAVDQITWNGTTPTTTSYWTFTDHQDSVRDIVSGNATNRGQVVEHRQYDSFGKIVKRVAGAQAGAPVTAGVGIDFGYAGRPLEARSGLSDNRARWYEPGTGRFINEDPSGFKGGDANLYRYVGNDPLDQVDPSGLCGVGVFKSPTMSPLSWSLLGQQAPLAPTVASTSTSQSAFAGLRAPQAQAQAAASMVLIGTPTTTVSGGSAYMPMAVPMGSMVQSVPAASSASGFGFRDAVSIGVGFLPGVGTAQSAVELVTGYDYIARQPANRWLAGIGLAAGLVPGGKAATKVAGEAVGAIGKTAGGVADVARVAGRREAASSIWEARRILAETRPELPTSDRNAIIKAFDLESFRVERLREPVFQFRYFDGLPSGAQRSGRWSSSEWIDSPADRISRLALPNNQATRAAGAMFMPGTTVFHGLTAPQLQYGPNLTGGASQMYRATGPTPLFREINTK